MAKKVEAYIKAASCSWYGKPSPPVGPALGQRGVNIMEFCKAFNAKNRINGKRSSLFLLLSLYTATVLSRS